MNVVIVLAFIGILGALAAAGFFMLRKGGSKGKGDMARALALRVALSVALFLFILLSWQMGWIHPTGLPLKPAT
ncbi:DUF2909 domain-containing protein [Pelomonas cellulosilytica]|uniref:DUF2909 domain-containing protein n=1 Tax=Pelomonas cellulosilytica TaxID=2906762 RepID=A0ABS8XWA9_9BURK|nr:DUF2909 domain-containing protein [Pelomonas sp. P8]MCE4554916.1 DUF2909 domain-containing protein [Pelomonas sp. P8]